MDKQMKALLEELPKVVERHLDLEGVPLTKLDAELEQIQHEKGLEVE